MISTVMTVCRLDEKSGRIFGRELRNDKLLNSGARGVNAPDMTNKDLASLLIALLATDKPAKSAKLCRYFGSMQLGPNEPWANDSGKLPTNPDHTFRELMERFCDPEVKVPKSIIIETHGTSGVSVKNEAIVRADGGCFTSSYIDRRGMERLEKLHSAIDCEDVDAETLNRVMAKMVDSPLSNLGLVTSRSLGADSIELIKMFMFPEHYHDELRRVSTAWEGE